MRDNQCRLIRADKVYVYFGEAAHVSEAGKLYTIKSFESPSSVKFAVKT